MMTLTVEKTQATASDLYLSGKFDGLIGLDKQSNDPNYLEGYYQGLTEFLGWN